MCTVSWVHGDDAYQLLCNRDERKTRRTASPPRLYRASKIQFLAPRDPEGGGTWIAANDLGVSLSLLNGSTVSGDPTHPRVASSRGMLPDQLIRLGSVDRIVAHLEEMSLAPFRPCTLLILAPGLPAHVLEWNGTDKRFQTNHSQYGFLTSSSYDPQGARGYRKVLFDGLHRELGAVNPAFLYSFHESHGKTPSAFSPCMHRPDAETVSFSWIRVNPAAVSFFYSPAAPCQWGPGESHEIRRTNCRTNCRTN